MIKYLKTIFFCHLEKSDMIQNSLFSLIWIFTPIVPIGTGCGTLPEYDPKTRNDWWTLISTPKHFQKLLVAKKLVFFFLLIIGHINNNFWL